MRVAVRSLFVAGLLTLALVVAGLVLLDGGNGSDDGADSPAADVPSTPLEDFDTSGVALEREAFCSGLAEESVSEALGGEPDSATPYENGERAPITRTLEDVAHEFNCSYVGADRTTARAWLFAPPVTADQARELATAADARPGCEPLPGAPAFGRPTIGLACANKQEQQVSYHGLFGDAWLTCTLTARPDEDRADLTDRAGRWCVAVAQAATR